MRLFAATIALALAIVPTAAVKTPVLPSYPEVRPGKPLAFPADHGAHPAFRTEWWYVTGWLRTEGGAPLGFQVTFFRSRPRVDQTNPSRFAPRQVVLAHAALSDPGLGHLLHDQSSARVGFGIAGAATGDADVRLRDWRLARGARGGWTARIAARDFVLDLALAPSQPELLQGERGYSRKGSAATQASYYYSLPALRVTGAVRRGGKPLRVTGSAWLDREWSSAPLDAKATGWDWTGINLDDGGALMAFQVRDEGGRPVYAGGSLRRADGSVTAFAPADVRFTARRRWRSPRTGGLYPVEQVVSVRLPEGIRSWALKPLFDDQELDGRASGTPVYWEGAVTTGGGRGYLEMTGYVDPVKL